MGKAMIVRLKTSDGKVYELDHSTICQSNLIRSMLEDLEFEEDTIPLPSVTSTIMDFVVTYAQAHKNDIHPKDKKLEFILTEADRELVKVPHKVLFELVLAANYLDFPGLLDLACRSIADSLKHKSIDDIYVEYDVPKENWYTLVEREAIAKEVKWVNDSLQ